jgi:hypothetical protein
MCADYNSARRAYLERMSWGRHTVETPPLDFGETFPGGTAPFLANTLPTEWTAGMFGLVPHWGYRRTRPGRPDGEPFALAGIWERRMGEAGR